MIKDIRMMISGVLLTWALRIVPDGVEKTELAKVLLQYSRKVLACEELREKYKCR